MNKIITKNYVYILIVAFMLSFSIGFFTTSYGLNEEASVGAQSEQYDKMKVTFVNIESRKTGTTFDTISDAVPASDMDSGGDRRRVYIPSQSYDSTRRLPSSADR